ncbi:methyltransferase-like protein 25 isoform X2 [Chelonia mydas]|uniref:methyltransferase-like protein 25 isoform X2 n=1 Tax=Chelonia mydas TaxID=8469 RepID=UPI0018A21B58|nr:methyltransferase-like protein 25 isoform X2 [Chelonia mydas]
MVNSARCSIRQPDHLRQGEPEPSGRQTSQIEHRGNFPPFGMSRSLGSLPPEPAAETVASRLRAVAQFLRRALPLCQAHTVEFYTRGLWEQLVALSPETVLEVLSGAGLLRQQQRPLEEAAGSGRAELWDNCKFSNVFCENSQKLVNVQFFALAAKYHSLPSLEVCTPLEQMLGALSGKQHKRCEIKTDEFMNNKKSHEVQKMSELIDSIANFCGIKQDCIMVGLHTCGDLAPNTLRIFTAKPEIKAVCSVGCCYHLLTEEFENQKDCSPGLWGFPMCRYLKEEGWCCGRNARMSACLALERVAVSQVLPTESLFYRAVLQVIIEECYGVIKSDRHVGKIFSKSSSFVDYVRKSLKKLELDESKLPDSCIMDYYEKYKHRMNELEAFNMLKVVLAPCIELLLLLDRLCYLKEKDNITWSGLVKLFDPVKSPRCYAVVALKK